MFAEHVSHVETEMYSPEFEDFGESIHVCYFLIPHQDATRLDIWVFERVEEMFQRASKNETLRELLHRFIFLANYLNK